MNRVSEHVRTTHERTGGALLDIFRGQMYDLNPVASRILDLLKGGSSDAEIADAIQAEFKVERLVMEQHVQDFLENLKKQGMIDAC
jgi:Coenzyme PQQ synthesis protein D (PqqD)